MEVDLLVSNAKIVSPCGLATAIGAPPGAKLRLCRDTDRPGQSRMTMCCDRRTAFHLKHRYSVPRVYAHDGQLTSLAFAGMRPTVVFEGDYHLDGSLGAGFRDGAAALPFASGGGRRIGRGGGVAKSSSFSAAMTLPTTPSSTPVAGGGVEVALDEVEKAEADDRRVPGISALHAEFLRRRMKTWREQRHDDDREEKLEDVRAERQSNNFATTAKDEEKTYASSHEATRGSSTDNWRPRLSRMRSWNEEEEGDEKEEEKGQNIT